MKLLTPEAYQLTMRDYLLEHDRSYACVGTGLGKTAATLLALAMLLSEGAISAALVVAPLRVARLTWPNEIEKWSNFKWIKFEILEGRPAKPSGKAHIYLTNYENLHNLRDLGFVDVIVVDESTRAKNPKSKRINQYLRAFMEPKHRRWALTGTPRPNSLLELFAQIRLLDDGKRLSPSFIHYRSTYFSATDYNEYNWVPKPGAEQKVYERISDITLTLRASDYLNIPETVVEDIEIKLPEDAHDLYKKLERDLVLYLQGETVVAQNAAILVNKLLQVSGGTIYGVAEEGQPKPVIEIHAGKINALKRLLLDLPGENVIIVCNYIHERDRVLKALGPDAKSLDQIKGDLEKVWNGGEIKYLVVHPDSMSHGLNLQGGGRTVVWFSPTWSREKYDQLNARVARKGQDQITLVYRLVCSGTMDEPVLEVLRERGEAQEEMAKVLSNWQKLGLTFST